MHISIHQQHKFVSEIIRAYDIRGIFGENLKEEDAFFIALKLLQARRNMGLNGRICVGYDGRLSSPALYRALLSGFMTSSVEIIDMGLIPTPALYFAASYLECIDMAVIITGSHNPSNHNGFKIILNGITLFGEDLKKLANLELIYDEENSKNFKITEYDISNEYIEVLKKLISNNNSLKVIWDPGNGAACNILKKLISQLPGQHLIINDEIDGNFPSHHPDPSKTENLQQLIAAVKSESYDFGIAFDGDADRLGVVDKNGNILFGSHLLFIFACDLIKRIPNAKILTDVKMSSLIMDELRKLDCHIIQYKTGHALIKAKMKEIGAMLAAEMSGHIFFAENYYGFDDAIFGACKFLEIAYQNPDLIKKSLEIMKQAFDIIEYKIAADDSQKENFMVNIITFLRNENYQLNEIDGIRVEEKKGWWLVRPSNTENIISLTGEAYTAEAVLEIKKILNKLIAIGTQK